MDVYEKHINLVEKVNQSKTTEEHMKNLLSLEAFRDGYRETSGFGFMLMACDSHYIDQGIDRPMCCGVWLDWKPKDKTEVKS